MVLLGVGRQACCFWQITPMTLDRCVLSRKGANCFSTCRLGGDTKALVVIIKRCAHTGEGDLPRHACCSNRWRESFHYGLERKRC